MKKHREQANETRDAATPDPSREGSRRRENAGYLVKQHHPGDGYRPWNLELRKDHWQGPTEREERDAQKQRIDKAKVAKAAKEANERMVSLAAVSSPALLRRQLADRAADRAAAERERQLLNRTPELAAANRRIDAKYEAATKSNDSWLQMLSERDAAHSKGIAL